MALTYRAGDHHAALWMIVVLEAHITRDCSRGERRGCIAEPRLRSSDTRTLKHTRQSHAKHVNHGPGNHGNRTSPALGEHHMFPGQVSSSRRRLLGSQRCFVLGTAPGSAQPGLTWSSRVSALGRVSVGRLKLLLVTRSTEDGTRNLMRSGRTPIVDTGRSAAAGGRRNCTATRRWTPRDGATTSPRTWTAAYRIRKPLN